MDERRGMPDEDKKVKAQPPQCCPYCSDSKFPCVKMERAIKKAVSEEMDKEKVGEEEA